MKKRRMLLAVLFLIGMAGTAQANNPPAPAVTFHASDAPGGWFECVTGTPVIGSIGCTPGALNLHLPGTNPYLIDQHSEEKSLAVIKTGETVAFTSDGKANTIHTVVSLINPKSDAAHPQFTTIDGSASEFDTDLEPNSNKPFNVRLNTPGLYVFFCDIHPYMFAAVIVADNPLNVLSAGVELGGIGGQLTLHKVVGETLDIPSASDLALRLLRTFFIATDPNNWQKFPASGSTPWVPKYPQVFVNVTPQGAPGSITVPLAETLSHYFHETDNLGAPLKTLSAPVHPSHVGVGQVWVDTQFEKTAHKTKPGTATAVDATTWTVERKVSHDLNNPHNMWTDRNQTVIYQTNWFDNTLTVFNRTTGAVVRNITVGPAPAHVMTRISDDFVHVSLNGGNDIVELHPLGTGRQKNLPMSLDPATQQTHPHAHWMGMKAGIDVMVTPNPDTEDSTLYDFAPYNMIAGIPVKVGHFPIATGMMPDSSKYFVANFLDSTLNVIKINAARGSMPMQDSHVGTIDLLGLNLTDLTLGCYNPVAIDLTLGVLAPITVPHIDLCHNSIGALPIQTPVSPDGKYIITANTLTGNILVTDLTSATPTVVKSLACDPGCHGVQFGAKQGGGYYAYVSSKFSNRMIVVDLHPRAATDCTDPTNVFSDKLPCVVGSVLLTASSSTHSDDRVTAYAGMGGQGVLPIPVVYNGWVQHLPDNWKALLTPAQKHPIGE